MKLSQKQKMNIQHLQPSQLYISQNKLNRVCDWLNPLAADAVQIPVIWLADKWVVTDGHTRLFEMLNQGISEVNVYEDPDELDLDAYLECVKWCEMEGVNTVKDLHNRILEEDEFQEKWIQRCQAMHEMLQTK